MTHVKHWFEKQNQNSYKTPETNFAQRQQCVNRERSHSISLFFWTIFITCVIFWKCFFFVKKSKIINYFQCFFLHLLFSHRDGENCETSYNGHHSFKHTKNSVIHGFNSPGIKEISKRDPIKEPFSKNCVPKKSSASM